MFAQDYKKEHFENVETHKKRIYYDALKRSLRFAKSFKSLLKSILIYFEYKLY